VKLVSEKSQILRPAFSLVVGLFGLHLFCAISIQAQEIPLANFTILPEAGFDEVGAEDVKASLRQLDLSISFPKRLTQTIIITRLDFNYLSADITRAGQSLESDPLYSLGPGWTVVRPLSSEWQVMATFSPRISSDLKEVGSEDIYLNGSAVIMRRVGKRLRYGVGLVVGSEFGEPFLFPFGLLNWSNGENLNVDLALPAQAQIVYSLRPGTAIGVQSSISGTEYNRNLEGNIDTSIKYSTFVSGPFIRQQIKGPLHFKLLMGTTLWRRFEFDERAPQDQADQENGVFLRAGLVMNPQR